NGTIAACNAVFALQADREHAGAFGGSPFTYTPNWSDKQCHRFCGMNNKIIIEMINRQEIDALLFEPDSFSVGFPGFFPVSEEFKAVIYEAINKNYVPAAKLRDLGSGEMDLLLYIPSNVVQNR
ncbi:hypothetical protein K8T06_05060, partial [bacterium]|nr:hypothetical protein [bacterium]